MVVRPFSSTIQGFRRMSVDPGQYEFSTEDNALFTRLAKKMRKVGFWFLVYGVALIAGFCFQLVWRRGGFNIDVTGLVAGLVFLLLGGQTRRSSREFQQVADTEGRDVSHLMQAIRELSRFYGLIEVVISVVVILVIVGLALFGLLLFLSVPSA
jgi:hypothetical protein